MSILDSDNQFPKLYLTNSGTSGTPAAGLGKLYVDSSKRLVYIDDTGASVLLSSALIDPMTTRGDIIVRNASNVTARLARGSAGFVLTSDGTDVAWAAGGSGAVATDSIWDAAGDLAVGTGANTAGKLTLGATNGMVLKVVAGAAAWSLPQGHELDYVEFTSDVSVTATAEASANTVVTATAISYSGSQRVKVEFWCTQIVTPATVNVGIQFFLYDGSSSIGLLGRTRTTASAALRVPVKLERYLTPSNASHTYSIRAIVESGTGTVGAGAGGTGIQMPGFIRTVVA